MNLEEGSLPSHGTLPLKVREDFMENPVVEKSFKERVDVRKAKKRIQLMPAFPGT